MDADGVVGAVSEGPPPSYGPEQGSLKSPIIRTRIRAEDLEKAMKVLRAVGGTKIVWELLHAVWKVLADE